MHFEHFQCIPSIASLVCRGLAIVLVYREASLAFELELGSWICAGWRKAGSVKETSVEISNAEMFETYVFL